MKLFMDHGWNGHSVHHRSTSLHQFFSAHFSSIWQDRTLDSHDLRHIGSWLSLTVLKHCWKYLCSTIFDQSSGQLQECSQIDLHWLQYVKFLNHPIFYRSVPLYSSPFEWLFSLFPWLLEHKNVLSILKSFKSIIDIIIVMFLILQIRTYGRFLFFILLFLLSVQFRRQQYWDDIHLPLTTDHSHIFNHAFSSRSQTSISHMLEIWHFVLNNKNRRQWS